MKRNTIDAFLQSLRGNGNIDAESSQISANSEELEQMRALWQQLPPHHSDTGQNIDESQCEEFKWILRGYEAAETQSKKPIEPRWKSLISPNNPQSTVFAFASLLLVFGLTLLHQQRQMAQYQRDVSELKDWFVQSTYDTRPSTDRIANLLQNRPISFASNQLETSLSAPDTNDGGNSASEITALLHTIKMDPSVNVRLVALQSLRPFLDQRSVRDELLKTLPFQTSSIVLLDLSEAFYQQATKEEILTLRQALKESPLEPKWLQKINIQNPQQI